MTFEEINGCVNCRHFKRHEKQGADETDGECRRYPPQLYDHDGNAYVAFPGVVVEEWCGEWKARQKMEGAMQ